MKGTINTVNGNVTIDEGVIAKYAGAVAVG